MKKTILIAMMSVAFAAVSSAAFVTCTVTSGTVLTSAQGGNAYSIANGTGTSSGGATGVISCPAITNGGSGTILNYQVLATVDYLGGPFNTTSGTTVNQLLTLAGGALNGSSVNAFISGGNSSSSVVPPVPFQIGATLNGGASYAAFTVNVASSVSAGGPVSASGGQVRLSYTVDNTPEPSTYILMSAGLLGFGLLRKRMVRK